MSSEKFDRSICQVFYSEMCGKTSGEGLKVRRTKCLARLKSISRTLQLGGKLVQWFLQAPRARVYSLFYFSPDAMLPLASDVSLVIGEGLIWHNAKLTCERPDHHTLVYWVQGIL